MLTLSGLSSIPALFIVTRVAISTPGLLIIALFIAVRCSGLIDIEFCIMELTILIVRSVATRLAISRAFKSVGLASRPVRETGRICTRLPSLLFTSKNTDCPGVMLTPESRRAVIV